MMATKLYKISFKYLGCQGKEERNDVERREDFLFSGIDVHATIMAPDEDENIYMSINLPL